MSPSTNVRPVALLLVSTVAACTVELDGSTETDPTTTTAATSTGAQTDPTATTAAASTGAQTDPTTTTAAADGSTTGSTSTAGPACDPDQAAIPGDAFFPEGVDATGAGTLYTGSITNGQIVAIAPCTADDRADRAEIFHDGSETRAITGILVDEANDVLWACDSDLPGGFATPPAVVGFDLTDGALVATHTIDSGLCNDLTLDDAGNLYATESLVSRIMRVDRADLLADSAAEEWSAGGYGDSLNGITFDGTDQILSVSTATGALYSTAILADGRAGPPAVVDLGGTVLPGADGLEPEAAGTYLVISGIDTGAALSRVSLDPAGNTVDVLDDTLDFSSTVVLIGSDAWIVESQSDDFSANTPPDLPFRIVRRSV